MTPPTPCCRNPDSLRNVRSPFAKIIALGYYDGPTSGLLQCPTCAAAYRFDMLDWDDDHAVRIFRLALLPPDAWERAIAAIAPCENPRWPVWVPWARSSPSPDVRNQVEREIKEILEQARPPEIIAAWTNYGENFLAARQIPSEELEGVPDWFSRDELGSLPDWFALLGFRKTARESHLPQV